MTNNETPAPASPSWLSSDGYAANGGFVPTGHVRKASPTGSMKNKRQAIKKSIIVDAGAGNTLSATEPTRHGRPTNPAKPITQGRVIAEGFYSFDGTIARVKISKSSGKPYGLVLNAETDDWTYTPGVVAKLSSDDVITYEQATAYGIRTHRCLICGRTLTVKESIARGIGPVCAGRMGWDGDTTDDTTDAAPADTTTPTVSDSFAHNLATVNRRIADLANYNVRPTEVTSWRELRDLVVAEGNESKLLNIIGALSKMMIDLDELARNRAADDTLAAFNADADDTTPDTTPTAAGPTVRNGRLDHSTCGHPRTPKARAACRAANR